MHKRFSKCLSQGHTSCESKAYFLSKILWELSSQKIAHLDGQLLIISEFHFYHLCYRMSFCKTCSHWPNKKSESTTITLTSLKCFVNHSSECKHLNFCKNIKTSVQTFKHLYKHLNICTNI